MKSVAEKMGIREDMRAYMLHAPKKIGETLDIPDVKLSTRLTGTFDYIHFFAKNQSDMRKNFPRLRKHLKETGSLWLSWRKGRVDTDLTLTKVIEIGYDYNLVESKTLRVDESWAAMKFTFPKKGKVYKNSYGKLKS